VSAAARAVSILVASTIAEDHRDGRPVPRARPSKKQRSRPAQTAARAPVPFGRLPVELLTAGVPLDADLEVER